MNKERLQALVAEGLPGAVAVGPDFAGAAGVANIETGEPLTTEHRFRIGSVTKIFVGALVLELVAEGTFNLGPLARRTLQNRLHHVRCAVQSPQGSPHTGQHTPQRRPQPEEAP